MGMTRNEPPTADDFLQLIKAHGTANPDVRLVQHSVIKAGPVTFKRAAVLHIRSRESGKETYPKLVLDAYDHRVSSGFDFDKPKYHWHCEGEEIDRLIAFLGAFSKATTPGAHAIVRLTDSNAAPLRSIIQALTAGSVEAPQLAGLVSALALRSRELRELPQLGEADNRRMVASALRAAHRSDALKSLVESIAVAAAETQFQEILDRNWWMLGGQYVRRVPWRHWTERDTLDMLLQTADGYFDVIELKRSDVTLCIKHRGEVIVSAEVNRAVNQAAHYISGIESRRANLQLDYGLDLYKLKAKVVIGHIDDGASDASAQREALRMYNSHLHDIQVITYDELVRIAEHVINCDLEECGQVAAHD